MKAIAFLLLFIAAPALCAEPAERCLLHPKPDDLSADLRPVVEKLLKPGEPIDPATMKSGPYFARMVTKKYVWKDGKPTATAVLGGTPFVFVSVPEAYQGLSLLQIYTAIGYTAEDVLTNQINDEEVLLVFRWEKDVCLCEAGDGKLPEAWAKAVYPATWDNLLGVTEKLAGDPEWHTVGGKRVLTKLQLQSEQQRDFVRGFPAAAKTRVRNTPYAVLKAENGADWAYRSFLERSMSLSEFYTGDGRCKPMAFGKSKYKTGIPEFIGPNRKLSELPEVAIIGLGTLRAVTQPPAPNGP